jgi:hypothetical protein
MSTQAYQQSGGPYATIPNPAIRSPRDPISGTDLINPNGGPYQIGNLWYNTGNGNLWEYVGGGNWVLQSSGGGAPIESLAGDTGVAVPTAGRVTLAGGTGLSTVASGSTVTFNVTGMGEKYTVVTANTSMGINQGYITNKSGSAAVMTLPVTAAVGSEITVVGQNSTGWSIAQNSGQTIHMNSASTTTGTGGSLASTAQYNVVSLLCTIANTDWTVTSSEGTLTVT